MFKLFVSILVFICYAANAQKVSVNSYESWVTTHDQKISYPESKKIENGCFIILSDEQYNAGLQQSYFHQMMLLTNEGGVQDNSQIEVHFDPSYQKVTFHHIRINRNGVVREQLKVNEFKVFRQETDVASFLYNGNSTALFIIKDVRVGDIIDYDYTVTGFNPVFKNKFYHQFYFSGDEPLGRIYYSVILPKGRKLQLRSFNDSPEAIMTNLSDGSVKYEWKVNDVKAHITEESVPEWYDDYPCTEVTEANTWKDIVDWTRSINPPTDKISPELKSFVNKIQQECSDNTEYLKRCVRFVQDEVRYMGIETSEHSHKPHSPDQTFKQKYGDCKDKSLLLCAMLNANKIEAYPALVNSTDDPQIIKYLPSPLLFDHCITYVIFNGKAYWFDPTISLERGPILQQYIPDYKFALIIKEGINELTPFPIIDAGKTKIVETFSMKNFSGAGLLRVVSKYYGGEADHMRSMFQNKSHEDIQNDYLDYYAKDYDSIKVSDPLILTDNESENILEVDESYSLDQPWEKRDGSNYYFEYGSSIISNRLFKISSRQRKSPISLNYPCDVDYKVIFNLPEAWEVDEEHTNIHNDFMEFDFKVNNISEGVTLNYKLKSFQDFVPATLASEYNKKREQILDVAGYELSWKENYDNAVSTNTAEDNKTNNRLVVFTFLVLLLSIFAATRVYRLRVQTSGININDPIGGVMIIPFIILFAAFIIEILIFIGGNFYDLNYLESMNSKNIISYDSEMMIVLLILANVPLIALTGLCIISFIKRRDILPRLMICFFVLSSLVLFFDGSLSDITKMEGVVEFRGAILNSLVWIPFFIYSNRVKDTFVVPYYSN
jgi:transglutaminase-like putative cysteine protease